MDRGGQEIVHLALTETAHFDFAGAAKGVDAVHVDGGDGVARGEQRMLHVVERAEKALLFRCERDERDGAIGWPLRVEAAREFDQSACACRVIEGAVADVVAVHWRAMAEMVPVGGIDDGFVWALRAGQNADDIVGGALLRRWFPDAASR